MRVAIVGAGLAGRWHAHAARKAGASLIAIVDPDSDKARRLATRLGGIQTYQSLTDMFSKQKPEVIHICTPTKTHAELALQAIGSGVAVMLEKPMAQTFNEVQQLYEHARDRKVQLCPVHQFLFQDGIKKILSQRSLAGEIVHLEAVVHSAGGQGKAGTGLDEIAADILPHPLSLIQNFLPANLPEQGWSVIHSRPGDLHCLGMKGNVGITVSISMNARPPVCSFLIVGTQGTFHADLFHGSSYFEPGSVSRGDKILRPFSSSLRSLSSAARNLVGRIVRWEPAYPGLTSLVSEFYLSVKTRSELPISPEHALSVARARDSLIRQIQV